jgi:hypothetical protein
MPTNTIATFTLQVCPISALINLDYEVEKTIKLHMGYNLFVQKQFVFYLGFIIGDFKVYQQ